MALNEHERQELAAIERRIAEEDPRLERRLRSGFIARLAINAFFAMLMLVATTAGVLLVSAGVAHGWTAMVVLGALVTVGGAGAAYAWFTTWSGR
jgi:hypothetical protein